LLLKPYLQIGNSRHLLGRISTKSFENVLKFKQSRLRNFINLFTQTLRALLPLIWITIFLASNPKYLGLIPNPINTTKIDFKPLEIEDKVIIFHGITANYHKRK
jgi:hypothetical protein